MTSILSLPSSTSSLLLPSGPDGFDHRCASVASIRSTGTVKHRQIRQFSSPSPLSVRQVKYSANLQPISSTVSTRNTGLKSPADRQHSHKDGDSDDSIIKPKRMTSSPIARDHVLESLYYRLDKEKLSLALGSEETESPLCRHDRKTEAEAEVDDEDDDNLDRPSGDEDILEITLDKEPLAFRRWISKLKRRRQQQPKTVEDGRSQWPLSSFDHQGASPRTSSPHLHRKTNSQSSSLRFVHAIKSATETLASTSIATVSRRNSHKHHGRRRSSIVSGPGPRNSTDSPPPFIDEAALERSRKRRQKLEEIVRTEEDYVADIKALSNMLKVYFTILGHHATQTSFIRPTAQRTLGEILHLHDDILGQLLRTVPFAEYDQKTAMPAASLSQRKHCRWHSVDAVSTRQTASRATLATIRQGRRSLNLSNSSDNNSPVLRCNPQVAAAVARVFMAQMHRLKVYEEFGISYDAVQRDIEETQQSIPAWQDFDRGIEALSVHVNPTRSQAMNSRRAMTVKDMLIKPIQRLPRYELLFGDLCRLTPACDDPEAHAVLGELVSRLHDLCQRVNEAKSCPNRANLLQAGLLIEDRLVFSSQVPRAIFSRLLGRVQLCGCLYIAYRGRERITGCYVACILFQTTLLLARIDEEDDRYLVLVGIGLASAMIEETDNGRGLQCHTAPHAWKLVFEHSARMYELIFVACSAVEAGVWRQHVGGEIQRQAHAVASGLSNAFDLHSPLISEMRSIGKAFGKPGSFVRRMSVHRAATVGHITDINQVIIKNTQAAKEAQDNTSQHPINITRSQSVVTPSHVLTLAPRRADRHRLENLMADVWTRDLLPYPCIVRRSDPIRASANNVIRKLSMAGIAGNFTSSKRSGSYSSLASSRQEDSVSSKSKRFGSARQQRSGKERAPRLIDFHNAPKAFLGADFELPDPVVKTAVSGSRALTMTMAERTSNPHATNENLTSDLRRAQSVRGRMRGIVTDSSSSSAANAKAVPRPATPARVNTPDPTPTNASYQPRQTRNEHPNTSAPDIARSARGKPRLLRLFTRD